MAGLAGVTGLGNMGYSTNTKDNKDPGPNVAILPPRRQSAGNLLAPTPQQPAPKAPVVKTFEELNERHREKMKSLQDPVTKAEKESADVRDAKERWERAKKAEKEAMMRKQAEKAAALKKQHGHGPDSPKSPGREQGAGEGARKKQSRSTSADRLGGSSSKRLSVLKVEDWQRYQATAGSKPAEGNTGGAGEFGVRKKESPVPFPGQSKTQQGRSQSRDQLGRGQDRRSRDLLT
jgi:hypothetical protein